MAGCAAPPWLLYLPPGRELWRYSGARVCAAGALRAISWGPFSDSTPAREGNCNRLEACCPTLDRRGLSVPRCSACCRLAAALCSGERLSAARAVSVTGRDTSGKATLAVLLRNLPPRLPALTTVASISYSWMASCSSGFCSGGCLGLGSFCRSLLSRVEVLVVFDGVTRLAVLISSAWIISTSTRWGLGGNGVCCVHHKLVSTMKCRASEAARPP